MKQSGTILVADDDRGVRDMFSSFLVGPDYRLLFAKNGKEAVEAALAHAPDLVVLDIMMPEMDGFEVCRRLRSDPRTREIPILIVTALNDHRSRLSGIEAGADDFISKPFDLDELAARIKSITRLNRYRTLLSERMKFERLFDLSPDGIIIADAEHNILLINPALRHIIGAHGAKDNVPARLDSLVVPDRRSSFQRLLKEAAVTSRSLIETVLVGPDGTHIPVEISAGAVRYTEIPALFLIVRDITERKRIQQQLRESEERFSNLFKTSTEIIFICDGDGRFIDINPAGQHLLGYSREQFLSMDFADICADRRSPDRLAAAMAETGFVKDFELALKSSDRATIDCQITATRINDPARHDVGFQGIIRDISEKKRFVDLTLDGINDGVFTVDARLQITYINSAAEEILGISREDSIGKDCADVIHSDVCGADSVLKEIMESNEEIIRKRTSFLGSGGRKIPVSLSATVLKNREAAMIGGLVIFRDLSAIEALKREIESSYTFEDIISKNHHIREIFSILPDISESGSTVLIEGPSGTGKELFARAIHNLSPRRAGPFIAVNCSAIPETLLESELFGYVKGAFTNALADKPARFALAEGGTLFLDEIGELSKLLQVKLLRVLEEREYEPLGAVKSVRTAARIIASTTRNMTREVAAGTFREDLFYRLNVLKITLPQLKERREDIPLLIDHFLRKYAGLMGKDIIGVSPDVLSFLMTYDFPGNVRELENIIEHACVLCRSDIVTVEHLPKELTDDGGSPEMITALRDRVMVSEKELIKTILAQHNGDRSKTARALNIGRTSLWRKMKKYRLL